MDNKKNGIPKLRFPGFTGAWEQRKLGEIYGKIGNAFVGTATPFYVDKDNGHFYLESNNVKDGHINRNNEIFINDEFYKKQQNKWLHTGDIVMVQSGHVGHSAVIPKELNNIAAHALIMFRYPVEKVEPNFINYQFQTIQSKKKIENITTGNTIKHILASDLRNFSVSIPVYSEQEKVGNFLKQLDHLIALHQRKLEHLQEQKKGLLQKMFPKNGEIVPEVRFPGFTDAWEQRKLGEVAEINPSSEIPDNFEYVDLESVVGTEMIAYRRENKKTAPSRAQRLAKKGDIFYQTVRPYQKNNYHFNLTRKDFVFSTGYAQLRPNINGDFLFVYIQLSNFVNEVLNRSTGTSYPAISPSNLIRMKVAIPTNNEQEKIGAFFKQLDSLIALHQRKLDHLELMKKGLLQQMFV